MENFDLELKSDAQEDSIGGNAQTKAEWEAIGEARRLLIQEDIVPEPKSWLRPEIIDSWVRCKKMGVDPYSSELASPLSEKDKNSILDIYSDMIRAAKPLIAKIEELNLAQDYIFELVARNGVTLIRTGNMDLHSIVAKDSVMNETTMGTNAHTLCMKYAMPLQVLGHEHYCQALQGLSAVASPVFDSNGIVVASLLLTQPLPEKPWSKDYHRLLAHALGLIMSIGMALEHEMSFQDSVARMAAVDRQLSAANAYSKGIKNVLEIAVGSSNDAILVVDAGGLVQHASPEAIHMLRTTSDAILGLPIDSILGLSWPDAFIPIIDNPRTTISTTVNSKPLSIRGNPVRRMEDGSLDGFVVRISEIKTAMPKTSAKSGEEANITFNDILGTSKAMTETIKVALRYAMTSENVLITGESGTGKEYFAQAIHNASRKHGPFMSVNCAAIPPRLIESELFGYESGAFTGADKAGKPGKIELADGGTLFLDEIGDMPLELQATLLRVLENKRVMRLGGKSYKQVNFRVVAATNRSLPKMVEDGLFREDLFYRLSILTVSLPPLRIRNGDVTFFAYYYLNECRRKTLEGPSGFTPEAEQLISDFPWPGNVRQIKNAIYSAFYAAVGDKIDVSDLPQYLRDGMGISPLHTGFDGPLFAEGAVTGISLDSGLGNSAREYTEPAEIHRDEKILLPESMLALDSVEESAIRLAMVYADGNVAKAAEMLQISKATLYRKLKEYGLR